MIKKCEYDWCKEAIGEKNPIFRGYRFYDGIQRGKIAYGTWNIFYVMGCWKAHMFPLYERKLAESYLLNVKVFITIPNYAIFLMT